MSPYLMILVIIVIIITIIIITIIIIMIIIIIQWQGEIWALLQGNQRETLSERRRTWVPNNFSLFLFTKCPTSRPTK